MMRLIAPAVVAFLAGCNPVVGQIIEEDFKTEGLRPNYWCFCQIDDDARVTFPADTDERGDFIARIPVDDFSLGGNKCRSGPPDYECGKPKALAGAAIFPLGQKPPQEPDLPEPLGPDRLAPPGIAPLAAPQESEHCTDEKELQAHRHKEDDACVQRQELRLQSFRHPADEAYSYAFRFRMPPEKELKNRIAGVRWVIAQWKQEPLSKTYERLGGEWGPGPFLALRFNGGVLHVTVQDEECRCMVAATPPLRPDGGWTENPPAGCILAVEDLKKVKSCRPRFRLEFANEPELPKPLGAWVEMQFRVQARRSPDATIEVSANGRSVVKVIGAIGYLPNEKETSLTKFKIGHYRDYIPDPHYMDIDWLNVEVAKP